MSPSRRQLAHFGAPAAFLLGVTVAVLLVRAGLNGGSPAPAHTISTVTHVTTHATRTHRATTTHRAATTPSGAQYVTVKKGDTFGSIAAAAGTTVAAIEALNPGVSSTALQVGQKIRVK